MNETERGIVAADTLADLWLKGPAQQVLLYSGLPASGKTKSALEWTAEDPDRRVRINYDDLRLELFGANWKFNFKGESLMQDTARSRAIAALKASKSIVVDNTNLTPRSRNKWKSLAEANNALYVEQEFDTPVALCKTRDAERTGKARVGWAVIDWMALSNGYIDWEDRVNYPRDFLIVDMDGTLTDCEWRRKFLEPKLTHKLDCTAVDSDGLFKNYSFIDNSTGRCKQCGIKPRKNWGAFFRGVGEDPPVKAVLQLVKYLYHHYDILIVSGRPIDQCGMATELWLREHLLSQGIIPRHLFMRKSQDQRPDTEVKQEILDLLPKNRISYVLDDRDVVVKMWRDNGLTCLQVANGAF